METKTEKMKWSKPILEELGKARYSLGLCDTGYGGGDSLPDCMTGPAAFVYVAGEAPMLRGS